MTPDWAGETAVLVGSGPSLTPVQACATCGRARVLAVNDSWRAVPWADLLYACDGKWWDAHQGVPGFPGAKWTQDAGAAARWALRFVKSENPPGMSRDPAVVHQGGTSGYQALNLALHLGARRILLVGYDYSKGHWFGDHPPPLNNTEFGERAKSFERAAVDIREHWPGVEVVNCTPGSAIDAFGRGEIGEELTKAGR
ncbi:MAG TPA: hypothetical protein VGA50_04545 [Kiloniellales bacterium]